ncbi:hypothetical protein [Duganella violaceipulchra]|uniref:Uncharacterized protein n=1 Tax=Duganella violaceipulchra TaxID=2849652 RepID=A0AA41H4C5_9BURK|nr:hypothetical protein [Duganella violaceicalia]MBV6319380.1 hypothetical protein [Duganella violaceicalia]MCP2006808.1 hypothetical protein [Duganella violaceicalia]
MFDITSKAVRLTPERAGFGGGGERRLPLKFSKIALGILIGIKNRSKSKHSRRHDFIPGLKQLTETGRFDAIYRKYLGDAKGARLEACNHSTGEPGADLPVGGRHDRRRRG